MHRMRTKLVTLYKLKIKEVLGPSRETEQPWNVAGQEQQASFWTSWSMAWAGASLQTHSFLCPRCFQTKEKRGSKVRTGLVSPWDNPQTTEPQLTNTAVVGAGWAESKGPQASTSYTDSFCNLGQVTSISVFFHQ